MGRKKKKKGKGQKLSGAVSRSDAEGRSGQARSPKSSLEAETKRGWPRQAAWGGALGAVALVFLVFKMFTMYPFAGDEHIYLYQAKLVSDGVAPYSGFAMAHPPLQTIFSALLFKIFGYHFLLGRMLPVLWCLTAGLVIAVMVKRELGAVASVAAAGLFLLSYEPMRASSHYTGVNMSMALLLSGVLATRMRATRTAAVLCVAAVFTRLYTVPGVMVLTAYTLLADRRRGLRLVAWGAAIGTAAFIAVGLWTGFGDMIHNMILYHAQKTPMREGSLAAMRDGVLFHNATLAALFVLSWPVQLARLSRAFDETQRRLPLLPRLVSAVGTSGLGLVFLSTTMAVFMLAVLLGMDRVWMYYFIPSFPFAAVAAGWLVSRFVNAAVEIARARGSLFLAGFSRTAFSWGAVLAVLFVAAFFLSPKLEGRLGYYKREMKKPPSERIHSYTWSPGLLPEAVSDIVKTVVWRDKRTIGEPYSSFAYYLWHESRVFDILDDVVETIKDNTSPEGEIFGDSGTVPLFALVSGRRIAGNEVDTNIQRYRSGNADPRELVKRIDTPKTEIIILRQRFGVAGVGEVQHLIKKKYRPIRSLKTAQGKIFHVYRRKS